MKKGKSPESMAIITALPIFFLNYPVFVNLPESEDHKKQAICSNSGWKAHWLRMLQIDKAPERP
jgi:hypothetical protein